MFKMRKVGCILFFSSVFYIFLIAIGQRTPSTTTLINGLNRDPSSVKFNFLRSLNDKPEIVLNDTRSLYSSGFVVGGKTIILVDGFDSPRTPFYKLLSDALSPRLRSRTNVILVDYRQLSGRDSWLATNTLGSLFLYLSVLRNTEIVGQRVADFINFLHTHGKIHPSQMHLIGMSLGCHVLGSASIFFNEKKRLKIGRITGLDPARTLYPLRIVRRLRSSSMSASFIDMYHTNKGTLGEIYEGTGDINVYVNGGALQPGCESNDFTFAPYPGLCSHLFAWEFFASTFSKNYLACPCSGFDCYCQNNCGDGSSCSAPLKVGINVDPRARGNYHVSVDDPQPGNYFKQIQSIFKPNPNRL